MGYIYNVSEIGGYIRKFDNAYDSIVIGNDMGRVTSLAFDTGSIIYDGYKPLNALCTMGRVDEITDAMRYAAKVDNARFIMDKFKAGYQIINACILVGIKFGEKNYMVDNKIIQIIHTNLKDNVKIEDITFSLGNGLAKYVFNISDYYFEITYAFIDNFYRIKLVKKHNNQIQNIIFLTKSQKFKKDIKLILKDLELSGKIFENHIFAFSTYISKILEKYEGLKYLEEAYIIDYKYDGIFI